jgi:3-hydroxybutyryl-CoA dehydrogenase
MNVKKIGIIGAGQMGSGIAQVAAQNGFEVLLSDISKEALEKAKAGIAQSCDRFIKKQTMTEQQKDQIIAGIKVSANFTDLKEVDFIIEAATENVNLKLDIFRKLDEVCRAGVILCSNTSSISITKIAASTKRPELVAGLHFMNPVPLMKLVEGIRALQTSEETFKTVRTVSEKMGKIFVEAKDSPGFVVNRILMPMINEAAFALHEGLASAKDIDEAMKLGTNQPMGPLALADFVGLDTCLSILNVLYDGLGDPKYRPSPLLVKYVEAGWFGKKVGRGFYQY